MLKMVQPQYSVHDQWIAVKTFRPSYYEAIAQGKVPDKRALIFEALRFIQEIRRCCEAERDGPRGEGNHWPVYERTFDERADDAKQRIIDFNAGDLVAVRRNAMPPDVTTAECLDRFFNDCLVGENKKRDWKVLNYLAKGEKVVGAQHLQEGSLRAAEKKFGITKATIAERRDRQVKAIWDAVMKAMPEPAKTVSADQMRREKAAA
jgi:hypothetical protein